MTLNLLKIIAKVTPSASPGGFAPEAPFGNVLSTIVDPEILSCCLDVCGFPRCSGVCFSLRRRVAFSSEVCPAPRSFFAARKKAQKRKMQYSQCKKTLFQGARSRRRRQKGSKNKRTGGRKTTAIPAHLFIGCALFSLRQSLLPKLPSAIAPKLRILSEIAP